MLSNCFRVTRSTLLKPSVTCIRVRNINEGPRYYPMAFGEPVEVEVGIVHFGVGRFHRAHQAVYIDEILQKGGYKWGICGVCMLPQDEKTYTALKKQNGVYNVIERDTSTTFAKRVGSLVEVIWGHQHPEDVLYTLGRSSVKIVTITVSEAGYYYHPTTKKLDFSHEDVLHDLELYRATVLHFCSPSAESDTPSALEPNPRTLFGYLSIGMLHRYLKKVNPFTVLSCDNMQGNGDLIRSLLIEFCESVEKTQLRTPGKYGRFLKWLNTAVTFPNSIVDRFTPTASEEEIDFLRYPMKDYLDFVPVSCEMYRQWVIENNFCNIKPKFETLQQVSLVSDIKPYEKIKIRYLNGGHSALAYAGHLAGFKTIEEAAVDETFQQFLRLFFQEVSVTLDAVEGLDQLEYQEQVLERFLNNKITDDVLRICKDGTSKITGFVMPTIVEVLEKEGASSQCLSFVVASWIAFIEKHFNEGISLDDGEGPALFALVEGMSAGTKTEQDQDQDRAEEVDVGVFLREQCLFGEIGQNAVFVSQVQAAHCRIAAEGVLSAMQALVGSQKLVIKAQLNNDNCAKEDNTT